MTDQNRSTRNRIGASLAIATAIILTGTTAYAEQVSARLWYAIETGVEGCPGAEAFQERVGTHAGYQPFTSEANLEIEVRIARGDNRLQGFIRFQGQALGEGPQFQMGETECFVLADALARAIAERLQSGDVNAPQNVEPPTSLRVVGHITPAPTSNTPQQQPGAVTVHSQQVRLRFASSDGEQLMFHRQGGMAMGVGYSGGNAVSIAAYSFEPICMSPCEASMPSGTHQLALSRGHGRRPVRTEIPTNIQSPATLVGSFESRRGIRIAGYLMTMLGGPALGLPFVISGIMQKEDSIYEYDLEPNWALLGTGIGLMIAAEIAGLVMMFQRDRAEIEVVPLGGDTETLP